MHGLTVPLVTRSDGEKFGKSADGALWLDPARTSPYALYQYFVNLPDSDVERYLLQLTLVPVDEARAVAAEHAKAPEQARGPAAPGLGDVRADPRRRRRRRSGCGLAGVHERERRRSRPSSSPRSSDEIPTTHTEVAGRDVIDLLVETGLAASKGEARRLIAGGGIYVNDVALAESRAAGARTICSTAAT